MMAARLTDEQRWQRSITEKAWQNHVDGVLDALGWITKHASTSMKLYRDRNGNNQLVGDKRQKGMLDTFAVHHRTGFVLHLELKRQTGRTTPEQNELIDALAILPTRMEGLNGLWPWRVGVLRPSDDDLLVALATDPENVRQSELSLR
jgi:hypothetical protein